MNIQSTKVINHLSEKFPGKTQFKRKFIDQAMNELNFIWKDLQDILDDKYRIKKGLYDYSSIINGTPLVQKPIQAPAAIQMSLVSIANTESYIPEVDKTYVKWGDFNNICQIIKSKLFYPTYISGLSGNGKSMMIEQACASLNREYIRVQISPETSEDCLLGGFRLENGDTVFTKGPVIRAMEKGAILLIDEIDRATNKIMCLQGVLEGRPILIKKTNEVIRPAPGFQVFATANTKGKGSEDGRFVAATIIDEAFLERFSATIEQEYPDLKVERTILNKHMEKYGKVDQEFGDKLTLWSECIRKTFSENGVDELISTRRLCHIAQSFAIFGDRLKSIKLCISRFDEDTKNAFMDLYTKIDASVTPNVVPSTTS